jgi:hypothetical protein
MLVHSERVAGVVHVGSHPRRLRASSIVGLLDVLGRGGGGRPVRITLDRATAPGRFGVRRQFSLFPTRWRPVEELRAYLEAAGSSPIRVDDTALAALLRLHGIEAIG